MEMLNAKKILSEFMENTVKFFVQIASLISDAAAFCRSLRFCDGVKLSLKRQRGDASEVGAGIAARHSRALIEAAAAGHLDVVQTLIPVSDPKAYGSEALRRAAFFGHLDVVQTLIPISDPKAENSDALRLAALAGHLDVVRALIPVSDPKANNSIALAGAAGSGHLHVVRELIPVSDPRAKGGEALNWAARNGRLDIVRVLLPVSDPEANADQAFCWAAGAGHLDVVRALLPISNPEANDSRALRWAAGAGHSSVVEALVPVSDPSRLFQLVVGNFDEMERAPDRWKSACVLNALTPYVGEADLEGAFRRVPRDLLTQLPNLATWHQSRLLQASISSSHASHSCRRRL